MRHRHGQLLAVCSRARISARRFLAPLFALLLLLCGKPGLAQSVGGVAYADSGNFTLDTTGLPVGGGGAAYADSGNFTLDTIGALPGGGGAAYADSGSFTLDTTALPPGGGGAAYADSGSFVLDTIGVLPEGGGAAYADSGNFTLDTTGLPVGGGGAAYADSGSFVLDTTGVPPGGGGVAYADSGYFTLDTTGLPPNVGSYTWTNTAGGNWSVAANWSPNVVPGPLDDAYITTPGSYTVTVYAAASVANLTLGGASGIQTLAINSPTFTLHSGGVVSGNGVLAFGGGTLSGPGPLTVNGALNWTGGTISTTSVTVNNVLTISGGATKLLEGACTLVNTATANWSGGTIELSSPAVISNAAGGTFNVTFGGTAVGVGGAGALFANAGQFNASAGSGNVAAMSVPFNNSGTLVVNSGTLGFQSPYAQTAGLTLLNGGNIDNTYGLEIQGGTLAGSGTVFGSVTNNGTVSPGAPLGQMAIGGDYVQTASGTLDIALGGTSPGTGFDWLIVTNTAFLAGTLNVSLANGFYPSPNAVFTFLNAHSLSNTFTTLVWPSNLGLQAEYAAASASVQVINLGPVLATIGNYTVNPGQAVSFTASATNNDPARTLTFSVTSGPGVIGASSGFYNWRPPVASAGTSTNVQVTVTDDGMPPLSDSKSFSITVNALAPLMLTSLACANGQFTMQISGTTGPDYIIAASTNLVNWSDLFTNLSPTTPFPFSDPAAGTLSQQYYRVRLAP